MYEEFTVEMAEELHEDRGLAIICNGDIKHIMTIPDNYEGMN